MKLKEIVKYAAVYLGLEKVVAYLENAEFSSDQNALAAVDSLTRCANLVINELACAFIPLKKQEEITAGDGKIYYSSLSETPLEIKNLTDESGKTAKFSVFPEYIATDAGKFSVEYEYAPANYGLDDTVGYSEREISARAIAYGVAAEYSMTVKSFDESVLFREKYENALSRILYQKNSVIKGRSFL